MPERQLLGLRVVVEPHLRAFLQAPVLEEGLELVQRAHLAGQAQPRLQSLRESLHELLALDLTSDMVPD